MITYGDDGFLNKNKKAKRTEKKKKKKD